MSRFTFRLTPADGTLSPASISVYGTRDRNHVYPFNTIGPAAGEVWKIDGIFVTNVHTAVAYFTITFALNNILRGDDNPGIPGTLAGSLIQYGNSLQPVTHYAWGQPLEAGQSEGIDTGGELLRGNGVDPGAVPGQSLWVAAWPGANANALGAGNDGVPPGILMSVHGERLA